MTDTTAELALLQGARLKGRLTAESATLFAGESAAVHITDLELRGLMKPGPAGARLTPAGKERLAELLAQERSAIDTANVRDLYEEFDRHNSALKEIVGAWQLRPDGTANDHADGAYDADVLNRLAAAHHDAAPLLNRIGAAVPRLGGYAHRFSKAIGRVRRGRHQWVANPLEDSYHQAWFELHQDLLGILELDRVDEAREGRA
ncbi:hypothetical protein [Streptomyces sp. NPDC051572]|uniref:hypothetical protein n=1 Tax=unclassified Streptomyces TaxID=2593676 RepID=UPI00344F4B23